MKATRGMVEAEYSKAITNFEKQHFGRGPSDARTFFVKDMILVRLTGVLTPAEERLAETAEGARLVKETRRQLFETSRPYLEEMVRQICACNLISLHTDMSTRTGERVIVMTVDTNLEERFPQKGE